MTREWHRLVRSNPPSLRDFMSQKALGLPLRNERFRDIWDGVSVQQTLLQARKLNETFRKNPCTWIAILEIPETADIRFKRTTDQIGHYTLWAEPEELIRYVREVVEIAAS